MGELAVLLTSMVTSAIVTGAFVAWDRRRLRRLRAPLEWHDATIQNAVFGGMLGVHFVPAFLCCGFRVFATREGHVLVRAAKALLATAVMLAVQLAVLTVILELLAWVGVPIPSEP